MTALIEAAEEAAAGQGRLLFVLGEAGIGKTALLRQFAATHPECRALTGACEPLQTPEALGPLFDIAPELGREVEVRLAGEDRRTEVFASVAGALRAGPKTALVVFEDVQWADQATLDLLRYLGRRIERLPAVIVATYREEDAGAGTPLALMLGDLATASSVQRICLGPLSEHATGILAAGTGTDAAELHRRTAGNPFFITEVLAAGEDNLPATVRDAVLTRLARLADPTRQAIEAAAAIGPRFDPAFLAGVLDAIGVPRWAMKAAVFTGFLRQDAADLAFRHALAQSAIADALQGDRLQSLHRVILNILQDPAFAADNYATLVFHAEGAGDGDAVLRYAPLAGARAAGLGAHRQAAMLYGKALDRARGQPPAKRAELAELQAAQLSLSGDIEQALNGYNAAAILWRENGDALGLGRSLARTASLSYLAGRHEEAASAEAGALDYLEALPPSRELALAYESRGRRLFMALEPAQAEHWSSRARAIAEEIGDAEAALNARPGAAAARFLAGEDSGRRELSGCLREAIALGQVELAARSMFYLGWLPTLRRDYADVEQCLIGGLAYCEEHELDYWRLLLSGTRARFCLDKGRWSEAEDLARRILAHSAPAPVAKLPVLATIGRLRARRGQTDAFCYLGEAREIAHAHRTLEAMTAALPARAEAAWLAGDLMAARCEAEAALATGIGLQDPWWAGELQCWLHRLGAISAASYPIAEPYALEMAGDWQAASDWWQQRGCRYEAALALSFGEDAAAISAAIATFDLLGAAPAGAWARRRLRQLGVAGIPRGPRPSTSDNPALLTRREQEVLGLVDEALTNAQIGSRLYLSPKTVERHLSNILRKLNASSRSEAVGNARRLGALTAPQDGGLRLPN
jgi:DNA-binding CsgD family transcriptional regulator